MRRVDLQEKEIVRQLIVDPRLSDNQIAKNSGIPLKTVNRKRKRLEEEGLLNYYTYLDTTEYGTGDFRTRQLYMITFRSGITRKKFMEKGLVFNTLLMKHIYESSIAEKDGRLMLVLVIESRHERDILEIINAEIVPMLNLQMGEDCIINIESVRLHAPLNLFHNYVPEQVMKPRYQPKIDTIFTIDQTSN